MLNREQTAIKCEHGMPNACHLLHEQYRSESLSFSIWIFPPSELRLWRPVFTWNTPSYRSYDWTSCLLDLAAHFEIFSYAYLNIYSLSIIKIFKTNCWLLKRKLLPGVFISTLQGSSYFFSSLLKIIYTFVECYLSKSIYRQHLSFFEDSIDALW